jgi:methylglyoxal synthase
MHHKLSPLPAKKRMALIAHDNQKDELREWASHNVEILSAHELFATGTTGYVLEKHLGLPVHKFISGPLGGDQQVGAKIAEGFIDILFFFWDPFEPMPHDPDVKALLRLAAAWNIPVACNASSADFILRSHWIDKPYSRRIPDYDSYIAERIQTLS